jgi:hypothetical protein
MQIKDVQRPRIAAEVNAIVRSFLAAATDRKAVRKGESSLELNLVGGDGGAAVTLREEDGYIRIRFTHSKRPACDLHIYQQPEIVEVHYAGETLPDWRARLEEMRHFAVGLPERSIYGWVEENRATALIIANQSVYHEGISCPAGLEAYVLEGKQLPRVLQMARNVDDSLMRDWYHRFWTNVTVGNIVALDSRVQNLPGEMWITYRNNQAFITVDVPDGQQPLLMNGPYQFWHPRERQPRELNILKNCSDSRRISLRQWFR